MKKQNYYHSRSVLSILFILVFAFFSKGIMAQEDCENTKFHGQGYTTTISSVTENENGSHTIILIVDHDGCPGPGCGAMSSYYVEADPGTFSDIEVQTLSGNFTYTGIGYYEPTGGWPFQGFRLIGTSGIGNGQAASFLSLIH
jgi:hypothetical protein